MEKQRFTLLTDVVRQLNHGKVDSDLPISNFLDLCGAECMTVPGIDVLIFVLGVQASCLKIYQKAVAIFLVRLLAAKTVVEFR